MSSVWDGSPQNGGNLLLLLALADFANDEGECWPSVPTLAKKSRMTERHVRRVLKILVDAGEIQIMPGAGQSGSNRYLVISSSPDKKSEGRSSPPPLTSDAETPDAGVSQTIMNHHEPSKEDGEKFVDWFLGLLKRTAAPDPKMTPTIRILWIDTFDKLLRIDGKTKAQIWKACEWARNDSFWRTNFYAPTKLRERKQGVARIDQFLDRMANENTSSPKPSSRGFTGSNVDAFAALDREMASKS